MDDCVRGLHAGAIGPSRVFVVGKVEVRTEGVEGLARVGEVCFQGVDRGVREGSKVDVEDLVACVEEIGDAVFAGCLRLLLTIEDLDVFVDNARSPVRIFLRKGQETKEKSCTNPFRNRP